VVLREPVIIGKNCRLENCIIGPHVTVGNDTVIKNASVSESIIFGNCQIDAPIHMTRSIVGENAVIVKNNVDTFHNFIVGDFSLVQI
jgi:glucose-1-phosphate thymidylyltransferase